MHLIISLPSVVVDAPFVCVSPTSAGNYFKDVASSSAFLSLSLSVLHLPGETDGRNSVVFLNLRNYNETEE